MKYYSAYVHSDEYVESQPINNEYVQVNSAGYYGFDNTYHSATHRKSGRKDYMLVYTHSGRSLARFKGEEQCIEAGEIFIYQPGEEHYYGQVENDPLSCYWIHFSGYGIPGLLQQLNFDHRNVITTGINDWLPATFDMLIHKITEKTSNNHILLSAMLLQLLHYISSKDGKQELTARKSKSSELINLSFNYMYLNYNRKITVVELAAISGLSVSRYINVFKEITGYTPKEYMIHIRLEKACEIISNTNLSIKEVALTTGFEDQLYFSRLFKKYKNMNPTEYRRTY
ncbi:AraC family transcriptional regulator [Paenibacillus tundrae]|uniref:AraC family transcriptional regulator n=1 Tax=Paenibacillus tundrae TaxID=528187 RepID=UPI0030CAF242